MSNITTLTDDQLITLMLGPDDTMARWAKDQFDKRHPEPPASTRTCCFEGCEQCQPQNAPRDGKLPLEDQVLSLFRDWPRVGVPFKQTRFLPETLEGKVDLSQFLEMEKSWLATNRRRGQLIDKDIAGTITAEERAHLVEVLQAYADYHLQKVSPRPTDFLDELERHLGGARRRP